MFPNRLFARLESAVSGADKARTSLDPSYSPQHRRRRFRERHPTLILGVLKLIAAAGLIYLIAHRLMH